MNCKSIQKNLAVSEPIGPREKLHIRGCLACQSFADYCASIGQRLALSGPDVLPDFKPVGKLRKRDWRVCAIGLASALVVVAPIATYVARGPRVASAIPPFHVILKGTSYVFGQEQPIDYEAWFNGTKLRTTSHDIDEITWVKGPVMWESSKPDGALKTEKARMASAEHGPRDLVYEGKYASAKFFSLLLEEYAPIVPPMTGHPQSDVNLPLVGTCSVQSYRIKPHHVGIVNRWQEDFQSTVLVFTDHASGKIVEIRQVVEEGNGRTATLEADYDYNPISPSEFDPDTLHPFPTSMPAKKVGG
jgi:hypothetical protein